MEARNGDESDVLIDHGAGVCSVERSGKSAGQSGGRRRPAQVPRLQLSGLTPVQQPQQQPQQSELEQQGLVLPQLRPAASCESITPVEAAAEAVGSGVAAGGQVLWQQLRPAPRLLPKPRQPSESDLLLEELAQARQRRWAQAGTADQEQGPGSNRPQFIWADYTHGGADVALRTLLQQLQDVRHGRLGAGAGEAAGRGMGGGGGALTARGWGHATALLLDVQVGEGSEVVLFDCDNVYLGTQGGWVCRWGMVLSWEF